MIPQLILHRAPALCVQLSPVVESRATYLTVKEWRAKHNRYRGRLNDMPDWSYADGRGFGPPLPANKRKYLRDQDLARSVIEKLKELHDAKRL